MSSPVHSVSSASQKPSAAPTRSPQPARKGSNHGGFSHLLRARPGACKGSRPVAGKQPGPRASSQSGARGAGLRAGGPGKEAACVAPPPRPLDEGRERHEAHHADGGDGPRGGGLLDPLTRSFAHGQMHMAAAASPPAALPPNPTLVHLDQMMTKLVRKVAWGGDGRRGAARIELGAGELAGATIIVQSDHGALSVDVELPPGAAADVWRERLEKRFKGRGFDLVELNVR